MKTIFKIFLIAVLLNSCAPIKRHARLVDKYPFVHTTDTVLLIDTFKVFIPEVKIDTVFSLQQLIDTVTIEKDRLKIKVYTVKDKIYISGKCDTVIVEKIITRKIPVKYYVEKKEFKILPWLIVAGIVLFTLYSLFRKREDEENKN
jgi:hypothetical protein